MLDNIFAFFEKLVLNFTWTRLTFLVSVLLLVAGGLAVFEFYTGHFRLDRLERETNVLKQLVEIAQHVEELPQTNPGKSAFDRMIHNLDHELAQPPLEIVGMPTVPSRMIYVALPWLILAILVLLTTTTGRFTAMLGLSFIAMPFIILGINLPTFEAEWVNNFGYPWGSVMLVIVIILLYQRRQSA